MQTLPLYVVDAFTQQAFAGNPAAVVLLDEALPEALMQAIASENNLSETAFVQPLSAPNHYAIRWFSPLTEVDFCGHATLASAHVLFHHKHVEGQLVFHTEKVGQLVVCRGPEGRIEMDFPRREPEPIDATPAALLAGLSIPPIAVLRSPQAWFAIYPDASQVVELTTDSAQLKLLAPYDVVATAPDSSAQADFVSRYFWPANGGDEDPVTGSIHAGLAPYWATRLNKSTLVAKQVSKRGGTLYCQVGSERVNVAGYALTYSRGQINADVIASNAGQADCHPDLSPD